MLSRLVAFSLGFLLVLGCAQTVTKEEMARAVEGYIVDVNKLAVVDCLLPGQVRKLGSTMTYLATPPGQDDRGRLRGPWRGVCCL